MLKELITGETIGLKVEAKTWEEAIFQGAWPLFEKGYIRGSYINKIIENVRDIGPYIVIAPGIALSHARPEDGVNTLSMALITLKEPVCFGSRDNDPVKLVITLAAIDNKSHLDALIELVDLLNRPNDVKNIINSSAKEEVIEIVSKYSV